MQVCKLLLIQTGVMFPAFLQPLLNNTPTSIFHLIKALWAEKFLQVWVFSFIFFQQLIHYLPATASAFITTMYRSDKTTRGTRCQVLHLRSETNSLSYLRQWKAANMMTHHSVGLFCFLNSTIWSWSQGNQSVVPRKWMKSQAPSIVKHVRGPFCSTKRHGSPCTNIFPSLIGTPALDRPMCHRLSGKTCLISLINLCTCLTFVHMEVHGSFVQYIFSMKIAVFLYK